MQAYDLIMLIVLAMATIFGAIKGFAWQLASIASVIVSYIVAYRFRFELSEMIQAAPPWNQFLAMLILYVGTSFVIWIAFRLLSSTIDRVRLKEFDRHLGAGFGFVKGLIYCLLITMFAMSLLGEDQQRAICQSRSGFYIATALDKGVGVLPKEIHDVVGPYLASLDDKLKSQQDGMASPNGESAPWDSPAVGQFFEQAQAITEGMRAVTDAAGQQNFSPNAFSNAPTWNATPSQPMPGSGSGFPNSGFSGSGQNAAPAGSTWGNSWGQNPGPSASNAGSGTQYSGSQYSGSQYSGTQNSAAPANPPYPANGLPEYPAGGYPGNTLRPGGSEMQQAQQPAYWPPRR